MAVGCDVDPMDGADVPTAISRLEAASVPATREQIEGWLVQLEAATKQAKSDLAKTVVALDLYAGALARWPADVAKAACMSLALRTGKPNWFPSLGELEAECERFGSGRRAMLAALRKSLTDKPDPRADRKAWQRLALTAESDAARCKVADPDRSSELEEFAAHAWKQARA